MSEASRGTESQTKSELRERFRGRVPADPVGASAQIVERLAGLLTTDDVVLTFSAMGDEPNLAGLAAHGATFALTRTPKTGPLTVHSSGVSLERHAWG